MTTSVSDVELFSGSTDSGKSNRMLDLIRSRSERWWIHEGEKSALKLFREASKRVPAYRKFMKQNGLNPASIRSISDFKNIPETDKKNYIKKYSIAERSWDGTLRDHSLIAASSGTEGSPTLWPRGRHQEAEATMVHEQLFLDLYEINKYKTLVIIGFPMGIYVSGIATVLPSFFTAIRHDNLCLLTAGNNKESILSVVPALQRQFDQIILVGHPFFIKDVIETGNRQGLNWSKSKVRTLFCSEGFNENWRDYLTSQIRGFNPTRDAFSMYGSSELLLIAYETPETICVRREVTKNSKYRDSLFGSPVVPNLFQYNPVLRYIESNSTKDLLFTARSGVPLIRYNMQDLGFTLSREEIKKNIKFSQKSSWAHWNLPYLALFGRSDHALVFYAANIYPEHIHEALNSEPFMKKLSGKFSMEKINTTSMDQKLVIHLELRQGERATSSLLIKLEKHIVKTLERVNLEYLFLRNNLDKNLVPKIVLHEYRDKNYFRVGVKPSYILK